MLIHRIRLANFRQHEATNLELGPGLTGIVGANGAGKTTLLEAIAFVMYGAPAARGSRDSIRRRGAPPRAPVEVEMEFELGAHRHRVVRGLTRAELYLDGGTAPVATGLDGVTARVERLLGMTRDEFFNTYFTGQKELAVMASMKPVERAKFLSRVLGYEKLGAAQERARSQRSEVSGRASALRATLPDVAVIAEGERAAAERERMAVAAEAAVAARLAATRARVAGLQPQVDALAGRRDTAARVDADLRVALAAQETAGAAVARGEAALRTATEAAARLAELEVQLAPLDAVRQEEQALARAAEGMRDRDALERTRASEAARLAELDGTIAALPTPEALAALVARGKRLRSEFDEVERVAAELRQHWTSDRQEAETKRQALLDQYQDLRDQAERVTAAGDAGPCPTCGKPLGDGRAQVLAMLADKVEEVTLNGEFYARRIEQLKEEPEDLRTADARRAGLAVELEEARRTHALLQAEAKRGDDLRAQRAAAAARLAELTSRVEAAPPAYDAARHAELKAAVARLELLARERERASLAAAERAPAEAALGAARAALAAAQAEAARLEAERKAVAFDAAAFAAAQAALQAADAEDRAAQVALVAAQGETAAAREAVARAAAARADVERRQREVADAERELLLRNELDRAFTDLRTDLNAALRPELAELSSGFLSDLTDGRYTDLELDEQYVATIVDDGEAKPVISGGEEDVVNLALRLAISQMIADRAGQPLSLLVLDEIFGSLDEVRRAAVVELLRGLADRFPQVILITHIDSVRDGFDRIVRVTYDGEQRTSVVSDEPLEGRDVAA